MVLKLFLFYDIYKQWITARNNKKGAEKYVSICYCFIQRYAKILGTVITVSANVTSVLITPLAPDDAANSNKSLYTCTSQSENKD